MLKSRGIVAPFLFPIIAAAALSIAACGPAGGPAAARPGSSGLAAPAAGESLPGGISAAVAANSPAAAPQPVPGAAAPAQAAPARREATTAKAPAAAAPSAPGSFGNAAQTQLPFTSAGDLARFEAALSAGTALAGPEAAESAEAWARAVEAAGAMDDTIARLEVEAAKTDAPPQVAFALAALYGRKETLKAQGKVEELVTGSIRALSEPAGALVFLDGKERGTTPLLIEGLKAGDCALRFELEGYDAQGGRLALGTGEPASFSAAMKANQGELIIRYTLASAADAGAVRAWLGGKDLGLSKYATHTVLRLPFGSHAIRVEAPGYAPAERTVVTSLLEEAVVIKLAKK